MKNTHVRQRPFDSKASARLKSLFGVGSGSQPVGGQKSAPLVLSATGRMLAAQARVMGLQPATPKLGVGWSDPHSPPNNGLFAKRGEKMNIDNCLQCFCVKFKRPKRSNWTGRECEIGGDGFIALPCSRRGAEIDGRHNDFCAERLFELRGRGDGGTGGTGGEKGVLGGARGRRQSGKGLALKWN